MSDFTPITTQEEFDKAIKGRLAQKDREFEEKYKDYLSPDKVSELKKDYENKLEESKKLVKETQDKLKENESFVVELKARAEKAENSILKNKIADQHKIPIGLADRLVGETEDDLNKDAEKVKAYLEEAKKAGGTPPLYTRETNNTGSGSATDAAMLGLLSALTQNPQ